ncbi:pyridoxal phosphate-dependent aminotransferase [Streptomyces sp. NPDC056948]|uniref:pyridoxal phosphate-dependent aminotransferase n=1 Tax=Streptomyces sp. NPDC056948 TaxID=3345975 RepID=UPI003624ED1D
MSISEYAIQQWLFDEARGRYDIDLAESGVQFRLLRDLEIQPDWELDYSLDRGRPQLRGAIAEMYGGHDGAVSAGHVAVTHGAQEALYLLYRTLLRAGDHVVTTSPGWQQAWEVPRHIGCDVTVLPWPPGERFDIEALLRALGPRTRMITLNSPGNPSGCVLDPDDWAAVMEVAAERGIWVVNDEEYLLDFDKSVVHRHSRAISVSGLSKVFGMPALRLGWVVAAGDVIEGVVNYKRYTTVSNSLVWERAAELVLQRRAEHVDRFRRLVEPGLRTLRDFAGRHTDTVRLVPPQGTPFAWVNTLTEASSRDIAERLLEQHRTLVMPAEVFGAEKALRVSFARPAEVLEEGLERLGKVLADVG